MFWPIVWFIVAFVSALVGFVDEKSAKEMLAIITFFPSTLLCIVTFVENRAK